MCVCVCVGVCVFVVNQVAVLAKRKTPLMKEIEGANKDGNDMRKLRAERRQERSKQNVLPDSSTADFERQLKKLATRGGE